MHNNTAVISPDSEVSDDYRLLTALFFRVFLGEYSLFNKREPLPRQEFSVSKIQKHPYYQFSPQADRYDVAVLRLDRPVRYSKAIHFFDIVNFYSFIKIMNG